MADNSIINWLMEGDVSIQYQVMRDILGKESPQLQNRISMEGWGARFMASRNKDGHWGSWFYLPKWTSSHYTLQDLKNLCISNDQQEIRETIRLISESNKAKDGGISPVKSRSKSDVCVNGIFLNYASYFMTDQARLESVVDFILSQQMDDGGFNCFSNCRGAVHSSLHTTLCVLEGILEFGKRGYTYRLVELKKTEEESGEFILKHRLFRSDRTGKIIDPKMLMLSFPSRWRYDILRALEYFAHSRRGFDERMEDALLILKKKRMVDGKWPLQRRHPGIVHFDMEKPGQPSRWNTLRALRVLNHFGQLDYSAMF